MTARETAELRDRVARARLTSEPESMTCSQCGCHHDNLTAGCKQCASRHSHRRLRGQANALPRRMPVLSGGQSQGQRRTSGSVSPRAPMLPGGDDASAGAAVSGSPVASPPESIRIQPASKRVRGHCIYCGRHSLGRTCAYHRDLVQLEAEGA